MPSRRRLLQTIAAAGALGAGAWALMAPARGNAYYRGPVSDHFDGLRFFNPGGIEPKQDAECRTNHPSARGGVSRWPALVEFLKRSHTEMATNCALGLPCRRL